LTQTFRIAGLALVALLPCQAIALNQLDFSFSAPLDEATKDLIERDSVLAQSKADGNTDPQDW